MFHKCSEPSLLHASDADIHQPISSSVQTMLLCARSCHRTLSSVPGEHRTTSYTVAFRSAIIIFRLLCTVDNDQVRCTLVHSCTFSGYITLM